jgi:hypothetical protein
MQRRQVHGKLAQTDVRAVLIACDMANAVSGKGSQPIIDITGAKVVEAFNGCEYAI